MTCIHTIFYKVANCQTPRPPSSTPPIPTRIAVSPHRSAKNPASGNSRIIAIEKNMLFTEMSVARCPDGIRLLSCSDWTG